MQEHVDKQALLSLAIWQMGLHTWGSTLLGCSQHSIVSSMEPAHSNCIAICPASNPGLDLLSVNCHKHMAVTAMMVAAPRLAIGTQPTVMMPQ